MCSKVSPRADPWLARLLWRHYYVTAAAWNKEYSENRVSPSMAYRMAFELVLKGHLRQYICKWDRKEKTMIKKYWFTNDKSVYSRSSDFIYLDSRRVNVYGRERTHKPTKQCDFCFFKYGYGMFYYRMLIFIKQFFILLRLLLSLSVLAATKS